MCSWERTVSCCVSCTIHSHLLFLFFHSHLQSILKLDIHFQDSCDREPLTERRSVYILFHAIILFCLLPGYSSKCLKYIYLPFPIYLIFVLIRNYHLHFVLFLVNNLHTYVSFVLHSLQSCHFCGRFSLYTIFLMLYTARISCKFIYVLLTYGSKTTS